MYGHVTQWKECHASNVEVGSSNLSVITKIDERFFEMPSNFQFRITAHENLPLAMQMAFTYQKNAVGFRVSKTHGLIFYWTDSRKQFYQRMPIKMDYALAADFAQRWLSEQVYPQEPDHDGDNEKGWTLYNEDRWGHVDDEYEAFIAIKPDWIEYGK